MPTATISGPSTRPAAAQERPQTLSPAPLQPRNYVFYQTNPANSNKTNGKRHFFPPQTLPRFHPKSPRFPPFTPPFYPLFEPTNQPVRPPRNHPSDSLERSVFAPDSRQSGGSTLTPEPATFGSNQCRSLN